VAAVVAAAEDRAEAAAVADDVAALAVAVAAATNEKEIADTNQIDSTALTIGGSALSTTIRTGKTGSLTVGSGTFVVPLIAETAWVEVSQAK
jgi:hypothetical protein